MCRETKEQLISPVHLLNSFRGDPLQSARVRPVWTSIQEAKWKETNGPQLSGEKRKLGALYYFKYRINLVFPSKRCFALHILFSFQPDFLHVFAKSHSNCENNVQK